MMTDMVTTEGMFPTEIREFRGTCSAEGCERGVIWKALYSEEKGAVPGGTPICDRCAEEDAVVDRRPTYDHPILQGLHECGVDVARYGDMTLTSWDDTHDPHVGEARRFLAKVTGAKPAGVGLYLHGPTGNGKTSLAVACLRELLERKVWSRHLRFTLSRPFLRHLTDAYRSGEADRIVQRAKAHRLLVLDELGKEPPTEHSVGILGEIIDQRRGGTIITSNHSLAELAERYIHVDGMEHLVSRLAPFVPLEFKGPDRRFRR